MIIVIIRQNRHELAQAKDGWKSANMRGERRYTWRGCTGQQTGSVVALVREMVTRKMHVIHRGDILFVMIVQ
jgi:hypothetical protein